MKKAEINFKNQVDLQARKTLKPLIYQIKDAKWCVIFQK